MATLFDLAQQYLNRALPETFKYDRTNPPTIGPITKPIQPTPGPAVPLLPRPSGNQEGFSVYNPDPNRTRTSNQYSPYAYRQALSRSDVGIPSQIQTSEFLYGPQLKGIPAAISDYAKNSFLGKGLDAISNMMPVNRTGILQNELLGAGFQLNDIGQIVGDPRTAEGVMSGMNTSRMDAGSFDKKSAGIEKTLSGKYGLTKGEIDSIKAGNITDAIKEKTFNKTMGTTTNLVQDLRNVEIAKNKFEGVIDKTNLVFDDKSLQKDPDYKSTQELKDIRNDFIDIGIQAANDDSEDYMLDLDVEDKINKSGIKTIKNPFEETRKITNNNNKVTTSTGKIQKSKNAFNYQDRDRGTRGAPKKTKAKTYAEARDNNPNNSTSKSKSKSVSKTNKDYGQFGRRQQQTSQGGGAGNSSGGCFLRGTLITMLDGTKKPVEQVDLGNEVAIGGKVFATGKFLVKNLHDYKGIKVSGSHMVSENNKWVRVEDSEHGKLLGNEEHTVYVFGSENRRILINDILFTDYFEVNEQDKLINNEEDFFDNWKLYAKQDSGNNVDIINAS